jgi:hypothetical protein
LLCLYAPPLAWIEKGRNTKQGGELKVQTCKQ